MNSEPQKALDILTVLNCRDQRADLDQLAFGVAVRPDTRGFWTPFDEPGEIYVVDLEGDPISDSQGREFAGEGRRPWKWDTKIEIFATLDEARQRSLQVKAQYQMGTPQLPRTWETP